MISVQLLCPVWPDFYLKLALVHRWVKDRPRFFPDTGGKQSLVEFQLDNTGKNMLLYGCYDSLSTEAAHLFSLLSAERLSSTLCRVHITSPRQTDRIKLKAAILTAMDDLFRNTIVEKLVTTVPRYEGRHLHKGNERLCRELEFEPTKIKFTDENNHVWTEYALTRKAWAKDYYRNRWRKDYNEHKTES